MQWKYISGEVRKRDGYKCVKCGSVRSLHVHHKVYVYGRMPWEYNEKYLETLCKKCHGKEHECKKSFTTRDKNVKRDSEPRKIREKKKKKVVAKIKISKELTDKRKLLESQGKIPTQPLFETKLKSY
jgi:5-methylcytosine-specific restriction endonuclease McrA